MTCDYVLLVIFNPTLGKGYEKSYRERNQIFESYLKLFRFKDKIYIHKLRGRRLIFKY